MMVSVIIPVYNVENYICRCLDSLFKQTYQDFEIILVDDCGLDRSMARARAYIEKNQWGEKVQYVYHDKNRGPSVARNSGIYAARGEYIFFIDGDDTINSDCLELMVHHAQHDDVDYVMAKCELIFPSGRVDKNVCVFENKQTLKCDELVKMYRRGDLPWSACNKLIRKSFIDNNHLYFNSATMTEDLLWNFESFLHIKKIILLDNYTYQYFREREGSTTYSAQKGAPSTAYDMLSVMETCGKSLEQVKPSIQIVKLYLELRYNFLPYSLFWHGYDKDVKKGILNKVFKGRLGRYYRYLSLGKKVLFLFPFPIIYQWCKLKFRCSELKYAIRYYMKKMTGSVRRDAAKS